MSFKIKYQFKDDGKSYSCVVTREQYENFKKLPSILECKIIKEEPNVSDYQEDMQKAINLAVKNNTTHIRKLSEIVK